MVTTREVSGRKLLRNTLVNGISSSSSAVITLLMTPLLLSHLGVDGYGIWILATTLTVTRGLFALADLGLTEATVRAVAAARAHGDDLAISELTATACVVYLGVATVLMGVVVVLAPFLVSLYSVAPGVRHVARVVFTIIGVQLVFDLPALAYMAVVEGAQRYDLMRVVQVGNRLLWAGGSAVLVLRGGGPVAVAGVSLGCSMLALVGAMSAARLVQPGLSWSLGHASRARLREVGRYGSTVFLLRVLSAIYGQMDRLIVGSLLTAVALATYEVAYNVHTFALTAVTIAGSALVPAAAFAQAAGDVELLRSMYLRGTKYAVALVVPVTVAAQLYADPLVTTWVGEEFRDAVPVARLFLLYPAFVSVHAVGLSMLVGLGRVGETVRYVVVSVVLNLGLSVALAPRLGVPGVVLGSLAGFMVVWLPYTRLFLRTFAVDPRTWFTSTVLPNAPGLLAQVVVGALTVGVASRLDSLWQVALMCGASCCVYLGVFALTGLSASERRTVRNALQPASR